MKPGPPNLASTVARFSYPVTVYEYGESERNAQGWRVTQPPVPRTIEAHCYPAPGQVIDRLPEGQRNRGTIAGSFAGELKPSNETTQIRGDVIEWDSRLWEVVEVGPYSSGSTGARTWRTFVAQLIDREVEE